MVSNMCFFFFRKKKQYQTTTIFLIAARVKCTASRACVSIWCFMGVSQTLENHPSKQGPFRLPPAAFASRIHRLSVAPWVSSSFCRGWTFAFSNRRQPAGGKFLRRSATGIFVVGGVYFLWWKKHIFCNCLYTVLGCTLWISSVRCLYHV